MTICHGYYLLAYTWCRGQTSNCRWRLSSSVVVCNTRVCNVTHLGAARDGGPVVLRPVRAIPCLNKKLSYRKWTARRVMLVNSCYVSRGMGVRKVSSSKSDFQGHSRPLAMVPFDRPHTIFYQSSIATMSLSCTVSEILSLISQNLKCSGDSEHAPFGGYISCMHY